MNTQKKGMTGKDIITVGIFSAIYFVINFTSLRWEFSPPSTLSSTLLLCFSAVCIPCFGS